VDAQGKPVPNVKVGINSSTTGARDTLTDAEGHFSFDVVEDARGVIVYLPGTVGKAPMQVYTVVDAGRNDVKLALPAAPH
jgi:5,10-methylene-tetrahydrofolate dehydrogenase/methenyl tetrahydrofolate cyclohydrolase